MCVRSTALSRIIKQPKGEKGMEQRTKRLPKGFINWYRVKMSKICKPRTATEREILKVYSNYLQRGFIN